MLCMKAPSRRSKVRETVKLPEEGHYERRQASRVWEQGKKAKPKATLDRTGSEQPSRIEDLEHERVRKIIFVIKNIIKQSVSKKMKIQFGQREYLDEKSGKSLQSNLMQLVF
ncbi:Hypothetical_protein [Hexamita inflata]|uniref:Hypothetical_protein n=1 Tax=Hexamita inflata TaxID=28002 RepID=A0ABP1KPS4_9EUKA